MNAAAKLPEVRIPRNIRLTYERFQDHFKGFEDLPAVRAIFGPKAKAVLRSLKVEFFSSRWGFMGVSDEDGHLLVSTHYLRTGNRRDIYLDGSTNSSTFASSGRERSCSRTASNTRISRPRSKPIGLASPKDVASG